MSFGTLLRNTRQARGLTVGRLAAALGFSTVYVSDVERGQRAPFRDADIERVARLLDVPMVDLIAAACEARGYVLLPVKTPEQAKAAAALWVTWRGVA